MKSETIGLDYEKEYIRLTFENGRLKAENEDLKKSILSMIKVYSTIDDMNTLFKDIEKELKTLSRRK